MHILLIHQAFAALNEPGGTRHHELARFLAARGHRVTVIASPVSYLTGSSIRTPSDPPPAPLRLPPNTAYLGGENEGGVTVLRAYTYHALHKSFVHRVFAFISFMISSFFLGLQVKHVDLVWGTSPPIFQGLTAWALARLKGKKLLFEVRDLWPEFAVAVGVLKNPVLIRIAVWLERFLYRHADQVMVNSPGYVDHVQQRGAARVALIPNGADPEMFDPADNGDLFRAAHDLQNVFVAMYAGAHGMSNDLGVVLRAAGLLADMSSVRVVLLGDGKEKPALEAQAAAMGLGNVLFLPPVPKSDMGKALAGADACIAILKPVEAYKTTYPNKVFDYMAAGRPVALAIDGAIREVVEAAEGGIFSAPGDATALAETIRALAMDPARAREMGLAGRKYLEEHFSRAAIGDKLLRVLEELVER